MQGESVLSRKEEKGRAGRDKPPSFYFSPVMVSSSNHQRLIASSITRSLSSMKAIMLLRNWRQLAVYRLLQSRRESA